MKRLIMLGSCMRTLSKMFLAGLLTGVLVAGTGCQKLLQERDALLKGQNVTVSVKIPDTPPPVAPPTMAPPPPSPGESRTAPPATALDSRLIPQSETTVPAATAPEQPAPPRNQQAVRTVITKADTVLEGRVITEDLTLRGTVLVRGSLAIAPQATLRLEAGTEVRFAPALNSQEKPLLLVLGRLVVQGTPQRPVHLGAAYDQPVAGDWGGVLLLSTEKKNSLEQCRITGAQAGITARYSQFSATGLQVSHCLVGVSLYDSVAVLSRPDIQRCDVGVRLADSEMELKDGTVRENRLGVLAQRSALVAGGLVVRNNSQEGLVFEQARFRISNSTLTENRSGIQVVGGEGLVALSRMSANREQGAAVRDARIRITDSRFTDNGGSGLLVEDVRGSATGSSFVNNGKFQVERQGREPFSAPLNWWGTTDERKVSDGIHDAGRASGQNLLQYLPLLSAAPAALP